MTTTEIIPSLELPAPLESALAKNEEFFLNLAPLKDVIRSTEIKTREDYAAVGAALSEVRSIRKNEIVPLWSPFFGVVDRVRDFLKQKRQAAENTCEELNGIAVAKMKQWEQKEAKAARVEEAKLQKQHPGAEVKPNLPPVAGYRRSTTYPISVTDAKALIKAFAKAYKASDSKRVQFLGRFIAIDEKALAAYAREIQNPEQFNHEIPGVWCRKEGA